MSALGLTGVFTDLTDAQRAYPRINMTTYSQLGGGTNVYTASYQPMWDLSDTATWVKGNHTFNAGFNFRSVDADRDLANEFLGGSTSAATSRGIPWPTCCSGTIRGRAPFQPAGFGGRAIAATRASTTSSTSRHTCRTTGKFVPLDRQRRPALGLPERRRTRRTTAWAGWTPRTRSAACASPTRTSSRGDHRRRQFLSVLRPDQSEGSVPRDFGSAARVCLAPDLRWSDGRARRLRRVLRLGRRA